MGNEQEVAILHFAPGTRIAVAQLHKINRTIEFGAPAQRLNLADARIDLHERTGAEEWVERGVFQANVAIEVVANIEVLNEGNGNLAPDFDDAGKEIGVIEIEGTIKANREGNGFFRVVNLEGGEVSIGEGLIELMESEFFEINAVEPQNFSESYVVDGAEAVELEDAGDGIGIFDLGEPRIGNLEFRVAFGFRDVLAEFSHITSSDPEAGTQVLQLQVWG